MAASAVGVSPNLPNVEGLLAALVVAPAAYSRNRFFEMYSHPQARRVHRRALQLRMMVVQILGVLSSDGDKAEISAKIEGTGELWLSFRVPKLGLKRTAHLDKMEASVFRFALWRGGRGVQEIPGALLETVVASMGGDRVVDQIEVERALSALLPMQMAAGQGG